MKENVLICGLAVTMTALCPYQLKGVGEEPFDPVPSGAVAVRPAGRLPAVDAYAEDLYAEYTAATGDQIRFEIEVLTAGKLVEIGNKPFGEMISIPEHRVRASLFGLAIREPQFVSLGGSRGKDPSAADQDPVTLRNLGYTLKQFEEIDFPAPAGSYRKLRVGVTIAGVTREHEVLELCWAPVKHCVVIDPVVVHVQSMVNTRLRLSAERWGPKVEFNRPEEPAEEQSQEACRLAGHPQWDSVLYRWNAWSADYKDALGTTFVHQEMGAQEVGIRCIGDSWETCRPTPLGSSFPSSCRVDDGSYTCACDNAFHFTATGGSARAIAGTRCGHSPPKHAEAKAEFTACTSWEVVGQVTGSDGEITDSCVWTVGK